MTTLSTDNDYAVLINTFRVQPDKADALLALLVEATDDVMRNVPGFVSANFHVSLDKTRVVNYAQWQSEAHFKAMLGDEEAKVHMMKAAEMADGYEPVLYTLRHTDSVEVTS